MNTALSFEPEDLMRWSCGEWRPGPPPKLVSSVTQDTRKLLPGALYVALPGARVDGHDHVRTAKEAGAGAALVSRERAGALAGLGIPLLVVENPSLALQALATGYRRKLGLTVVGITGSTGKTTVKEMIACLLSGSMPTACTMGNWNNEVGLPLSILAIPPGTKVGVLELGISHPGEMAPLCGIALPDHGVITNVGPVHLEFFESVAAIAREKGELFRSLPASGTAVLSLDEPHFGLLKSLVPGKVVTTSLRSNCAADYALVQDDPRTGDCTVVDRADGQTHRFRMTMPGLHNRHNALLAVAVARGLGVSWESLATAFERYVAPPMRWERREVAGLTVINDAYNANPVSMQAALRTFREMDAAGRKWLALGDMLELGAGGIEAHLAIGRSLANGPWAGLVTVGPLGARIAEGALVAGMPGAFVRTCGTAAEAAIYLKERMVKGDVLLLKASRGKRLEDIIPGLIEKAKD